MRLRLIIIFFSLAIKHLQSQNCFNYIHPYYSSINVSQYIHINKISDIDTLRKKILKKIWKKEAQLPSAHPNAITSDMTSAFFINDTIYPNLERIYEYRINMDLGFQSYVYLLLPRVSNDKLLIIHQGHGLPDEGGVKDTIGFFLGLGYSILFANMPLTANNIGPISEGGVEGHNLMPQLQSDSLNPLKFFFEPIAISLNYIDLHYDFQEISMIGISGGGWTTTLYAAIDPRIKNSFPVAGSLPGYLMEGPCPQPAGDWEQKIIEEPEKLSYLDLYILGAYGNGRRQIQILNKYDPCCFSGIQYLTYSNIVEERVRCLNTGEFKALSDTSHHEHKISEYARNYISFILNTPSDTTIRSNTILETSVDITLTEGSPIICEGTPITFTASPINGGPNPLFKWKNKNKEISGENNITYSSSILMNGDFISVTMISDNSCVTHRTVTSTNIPILVNPISAPSVSLIMTKGAATICQNTVVTFTATPINEGTSPTFQWRNRGRNIIGETGISYTSSTLVNGDSISVVLVRKDSCSNSQIALSNTIIMTVFPIPPTPLLSANDLSICKGDTITLTGTCPQKNDSFHWTTPNISTKDSPTFLSNTSNLIVTKPGIYKGFCDSGMGCKFSDEIALQIMEDSLCENSKFLNISPENPVICPNTSITLTASGCKDTLRWIGGGYVFFGSDITVRPDSTTTYFLQCSTGETASVRITVAKTNMEISSDIITGKYISKVLNSIEATNKIGVSDYTPAPNVLYEAGSFIILKPGFGIEKHSTFSALIKACPN